MAEPIDPALGRALDALTPPPLPADFAERVAARAAALPPPLPRPRAPSGRRWWRLGAGALGVVATGLLSISAAAMGYLGEPLARAVQAAPVIGPAIERVLPARHARLRPAAVAAKRTATPPPPIAPVVTPVLAQHPVLHRAVQRWRAMTPEQREAWLARYPRAAERIAARQAVRAEAMAAGAPPPRARIGERREWLRERIERRRARIEAWRARRNP